MAVNLFLRLLNRGVQIQGECRDPVFANMIQLQSFQMSSLSMLAQGAGEADSGDACSFTIKKLLDGSSIDLFLNYTQAQSPEKRQNCLLRGTVYVRADGPQPKRPSPDSICFLVLDFFDVFVYDYSLEGNQADDRPVEEVKFYFDKYQMTYREPYAADGVSLKPPFCVGWDFEAGESM